MPQPTALILDDDGTFARAAGQLAFSAGFRVQLAETLAEARTFLARTRADLVLLDLQLPDGSGMDLLDDVDLADHGQVVIVTGRPSLESATRAVSTPVIEYLVKPLDPAQLRRVMDRVAARWRPAGPPSVDLSAVSGIIGNAPQIRAVVDSVLRTGPTDASVLIWGEPGSGKALVASALHAASGRSGPLVTLDCSALAPDDLAAALFGTDTRSSAPVSRCNGSAFARAQGGTLFLDAIDRMPLDLQARLAEALEIPVPSRDTSGVPAPAPIRVLAASARDPEEAMRDRALRPDLYYALAQVSLALPSLRERGEDVVVLVGHFIERLNLHYGRAKRLAPGSEAALLRHSWPGNVRELRAAVQRAYLLEDGDDLHVRPQLPSDPVWKESDTSILFSVGTPLAEIERRALLKTLAHFDNDKTATARARGQRAHRPQPARAAGHPPRRCGRQRGMSDASPLQGADPAWLHALRNAVNAASVAVAAARSALDSGDPTRAGFFLDESAGACERASKLLHTHGARSDISAPGPGEGTPEQVRP